MPGPISFEERRRQRRDLPLRRLAQRPRMPRKRSRQRRFCPGHAGLQADRSSRSSSTRPATQPGERGYVEVQSDGRRVPSGRQRSTQKARRRRRDRQPRSAKKSGRNRWLRHRQSVTAQQFFLTDTPCSPERRNQPRRNQPATTSSTTRSAPAPAASQTGRRKPGAPDALLLGAPARSGPGRRSQPAALRLLERLLPRADARHGQGGADPPRRHQRAATTCRPAASIRRPRCTAG